MSDQVCEDFSSLSNERPVIITSQAMHERLESRIHGRGAIRQTYDEPKTKPIEKSSFA